MNFTLFFFFKFFYFIFCFTLASTTETIGSRPARAAYWLPLRYNESLAKPGQSTSGWIETSGPLVQEFMPVLAAVTP